MSDSSTDPSFSRYILYNEAVAYPGGTWTPRAASALLLSATPESITPEILLKWFEQSIIPLVGKEAATTLINLLKESKPRDVFIEQLRKYRLTLK